MHTAIIVASGAVLMPEACASLPEGAIVIAADGGVDAAHELALTVDVAIGDFDSVTPQGLAWAEAEGARIVRHSQAKDATDLELALDEAVAAGATHVVVLAAPAGRFDHLLANALVLARPEYDGISVAAHFGSARLHVIPDGSTAVLEAHPGAIVTLLPLRGPAASVRTEGLFFPLRDEPLAEGSTRGVSNVFEGHVAKVSVSGGTVLAVMP